MEPNFKFKMGEEVKDIVTGYVGIVMCRAQYSTGCNHYGVGKRGIVKDAKLPEWEYFDQTRLVLTGKKGIVFPFFDETKPTKSTSGPFQKPSVSNK